MRFLKDIFEIQIYNKLRIIRNRDIKDSIY